MSDLRGRVVVVTGASSGIGRATALQFGALGARVALVARREERLHEVAALVNASGGEALVLRSDVSVNEQVTAAAREVQDHWGRCDVLVNNAGSGVYGTVEECLPEDFEGQLAVNYLGSVYWTKALLPLMRSQRSGLIVNVSSISGRAAAPYDATYCASKAALSMFTHVLRLELAGSGIDVSLLTVGYTATEFNEALVRRRPHSVRTPLRPMPAEQVAAAIVSLVDRPRREVVLPRILALPLLLQTALPGVYDWWQSRFRRGRTGPSAG